MTLKSRLLMSGTAGIIGATLIRSASQLWLWMTHSVAGSRCLSGAKIQYPINKRNVRFAYKATRWGPPTDTSTWTVGLNVFLAMLVDRKILNPLFLVAAVKEVRLENIPLCRTRYLRCNQLLEHLQRSIFDRYPQHFF